MRGSDLTRHLDIFIRPSVFQSTQECIVRIGLLCWGTAFVGPFKRLPRRMLFSSFVWVLQMGSFWCPFQNFPKEAPTILRHPLAASSLGVVPHWDQTKTRRLASTHFSRATQRLRDRGSESNPRQVLDLQSLPSHGLFAFSWLSSDHPRKVTNF